VITVGENGWAFGGADQDTIKGGAGSWLNGDDGDDIIIGGAGFQQIVGGAGNDTLTGGADADRFDFGDNWGHDRITDFQVGVDHINMAGVTGLDRFDQLTITATAEGTEVSFGDNSIILSGVAIDTVTTELFQL
jgi:Ca2+-binding RTX toxin-like protein